MSEKKKLTTEEILALARKQNAGGTPPVSEEQPAAEAAAAETPAATPPPPAAPKSTADILAAARAQGASGKPAEKPAAAGGAPKSTADILAAARAQGSGEKKPAAAPKSTADILAAARAQKAGAAQPAGGEAGKAAAPSTSPAAPVPAGDRPALNEMIAAVKAAQAGKPVPAVRPGAPLKPRLPAKAAVAAEPVTRRGVLPVIVLTPFVSAWTAMGAVAGLWSLAVARYMMPNMVLELPSRFKVGPPSDFPPGSVSEKFKASRGIWIVRSDQYDGRDTIYVLSSVCTHLGCTPNWLEGEQKFKCPCHGSGFYVSGINFEGPAPRPLERVGIRRADDGMLEVDKSVKFQEELGQWSDAKSYFEIV